MVKCVFKKVDYLEESSDAVKFGIKLKHFQSIFGFQISFKMSEKKLVSRSLVAYIGQFD